MEFLTQNACLHWCRDHGYSIVNESLDERRQYPPVNFTIPQDAGARVALCRFLWAAVGPTEGDRLVWTTEWSIWPSGEYLPIVARLRQALGETRSLAEAPGIVCGVNDHDDGLSILILNCLFLWDCWVVTTTGAAVFLSHDEVGIVLTPDYRLRSEIADEFHRSR